MADGLSTREILEYAISLERRSVNLYTDLASSVQNGAIKKVFLEYAEEEMAHRKKLEDVLEGERRIDGTAVVTDMKISDYATPVALGDAPAYQDILLFAMQQEKQAFRLYMDLSERVAESEFKTLFRSLAQEEARHKLRFEVEYDEYVLTDN